MKKTFLCMILLLVCCGSAHGFAGGDGTAGNPYQVETAEHLGNVRNNLTAYYIQIDDIDLSGIANWEPIAGGGTGTIFTGSYDGQYYTISNMTINRSGTGNVGLFGLVGQGAIIKDVRLQGVDVIGAIGVGSLIGRVTGSAATTIERCSAVSGSVEGDRAVGGLVGSHNSITTTPGGTNNPVISQCYAKINVIMSNKAVGGAGSPDSEKKWKFGGLAGCSQKGTIIDSYARGSVNTENATSTYPAARVGGLVGCCELRGEIIRCYSTGAVEINAHTSLFGGLIGNVRSSGAGNDGVVINSYWDTDPLASNQSTSAGGEGKTTTEMKTQSTFIGWDFTNIWAIDTANDGYPYLLWQQNDPGTEGSVFVFRNRRGIDLNGIEDRVTMAHSATLDVSDDNTVTVEAWVKKNSTQSGDIVVVEKNGSYRLFFEDGNKPAFSIVDDSDVTRTASSGISVAPNRWYHLAGTFSNTSGVKIYINGYEAGPGSTPGAVGISDVGQYPVAIGADIILSEGFLHGTVDEVRIWNTAKSLTSIREFMCRKLFDVFAASPSPPANLMGYWRFEEALGPDCKDDSGNNNTGHIFYGSRVCSQAPIGDVSGYDYTGSVASEFEVVLDQPNLTIESFHVEANGGTWNTVNKSGLQVYWVENAFGDIGRGPLGWKLFRERGHFGVFVTGGSDPTYNLTYTYNPAGIGLQENLKLAFRSRNCEPWKDLKATIGSGVLTKQGQSGTEYILGAEMDPRNAIKFNPLNTDQHYVIADDDDGELSPTGQGTLEAWIYITHERTDAGIITKGDTTDGYALYTDDAVGNKLFFSLYDSGAETTVESDTALALETWHHIAAAWDGTYMNLYINGVLDDQSNPAANQDAGDTTGTSLYIGSFAGGGYFRGYIDEVRVWQVARDQTEIRDTMCRKLDSTKAEDDFSNLGGYWRFDEETDSAACPDYSDYSNTGTMTGFSDIREARICSSAPIGDDSAYSYHDGTNLPDVDPPLAHPDGDAFQATATTGGGTWSQDYGIHIYLLQEAPVYLPDLWDDSYYSYVSPNGLTPPTSWSSVDYYRYWGAFVTHQPATPLQYQVIYYYDGNPMVPADDSVVGLAKRNNYCDRNWIAADGTQDTVNKTLTKTGETGTEYILGGRDTPLAITLASFTAAVSENGCVDIQWETATEIDTLGFYLWRSTEKHGEYEMIPTSYTRSKSLTETMGATYAFTDCGMDLTSGDRYYYKLEEIEIGPKEARHFYGPIGPVSETVGASRPVRDTAPAPTGQGSGGSSCFIGALIN